MEIRRGIAKDKVFIADSQILMAEETEDLKLEIETVLKGVEYILNNDQVGAYYLFEENNEPKACLLVLKEWSDWRAGNVLWIHSVYVRKEYRGQGIYKKMYEFLKAEVIKNEELRGLRLYVDKTNENAIKVYEKLGMNKNHYHLYEWMKDF